MSRLIQAGLLLLNACVIVFLPLTSLFLCFELARGVYYFSTDQSIQWPAIKQALGYATIWWIVGIPWLFLRRQSLTYSTSSEMTKEEVESQLDAEKLNHALDQLKTLTGDRSRIDIIDEGDVFLIFNEPTKAWLSNEGFWTFEISEQADGIWEVELPNGISDLWSMLENIRRAGHINIYHIEYLRETQEKLQAHLSYLGDTSTLNLSVDESRLPVDYFTVQIEVELALKLSDAGIVLPASYYSDEEAETGATEDGASVIRHLDYSRFAHWADHIFKNAK